MHVADIRTVDRPTVGLIAEYAASGTAPGDPVKTAQAILQITQVDDPPLRLPLGSDAFTIARAADEAKIASDERWKDLTLSTDADDVGREDQNEALIFVATNGLKPGRSDAERHRREAAEHLAETVTIGGDLTVGRVGYGAMQLTGPKVWSEYPDHDRGVALLRQVVAEGVTFIDTADVYGPHSNEELIREALHPYPDDVVIATKGGFVRGGPGYTDMGAVGNRLYLRQAA